jgi:aminoglycoside phosphotransferase (APT) family kinase protein
MTKVNLNLAQRILEASQFSHKHLPLRSVETQGHDHRTFRCGDNYSMRIPSAKRYAAQINKEATWCAYLASRISVAIPKPIHYEAASKVLNRPWIMHTWIEGEAATRESITDLEAFIDDLALFITELQSIDVADGPKPGAHNFYRGAHPAYYHKEVVEALQTLKDDPHHNDYDRIWSAALRCPLNEHPVWIHGDLEISNLLTKDGNLQAVIDFGNMAIGDPACDYVMAWTFMNRMERTRFFNQVKLDEAMHCKAQGWALWKALITLTNPKQSLSNHQKARQTLNALVESR